MKLIIDRKKWLTPDYANLEKGSFLRRKSDGKMCCLGFLARTCHIRGITNISCPSDIPNKNWPKDILQEYKCGYYRDSDICAKIMSINDSEKLNRENREYLIKRLMRRINIVVSFIN